VKPGIVRVSRENRQNVMVIMMMSFSRILCGKSEVKNMDMIVKELEAIPESEAEEINE
jgi:3'-phosphoadenosine 5'-phosphosulfate sulfotransferase